MTEASSIITDSPITWQEDEPTGYTETVEVLRVSTWCNGYRSDHRYMYAALGDHPVTVYQYEEQGGGSTAPAMYSFGHHDIPDLLLQQSWLEQQSLLSH